MSNITKPATRSYSGFKRIEYVYADKIVSMPFTLTDTIDDSDIVLSQDDWFELYHVPQTLSIEENERDSDAGKTVDVTIKLNHPGDSAETTALMNMLRNRFVVMRIYDANNNCLMYGHKDWPLTFSYERKKGNSPGGNQHYEIQVKGKLLKSGIYISFTE